MNLNLNNIEEIIFYDRNVQNLLPEFRHYFDQWQLGNRIPAMKTLARRSVYEFFNSLNNEHRKILESYYNCNIILEKIDNRLCMNTELNITDVENNLCEFTGFAEINAYRTKDKVYLTFWR